MVDAWWLVGAFALAFFGMAWFALALKPHWEQARGAQLSASNARRLRLWGALSLLLSLFGCLAADHASMAVLVWVMALSCSALAVAMMLAYAPRSLNWLTIVADSSSR